MITNTHTLYSTVIMASVVGGIGASSILPLILATILAYCVTGYVRDELYHPFVKTCVGPVCNIFVRIEDTHFSSNSFNTKSHIFAHMYVCVLI